MINIKAVVSYVFIVGTAVLYTLFLEAKGGCYLITALAAAALISVLICVYTKRKLSVLVWVSEDVLNRGDVVSVHVLLKKSGVLPSSFINAEMYSSYHFSSSSPQKIKTAVFGTGRVDFTADYRAGYFGKGRIGIGTVTVSDYLGLCSFVVPVSKPSEEIKIYPNVPEVNAREGLARSLTDTAVFDESEETTQSLFAVSGTPGYEHRKYEPGDSLKLINWKLSAKRGDLLVRRLEGASGSEQIFILDKAGSRLSDMNAVHDAQQLVTEAMLGLMKQFARSELPTRLMIRFGDIWESIPLLTLSDIADLRYRLTDFVFSDNAVNRLPQDIKGRAVVFTARCDESIVSFVNSSENYSAAADSCEVSSDRIWKADRV